MWICWPSAELFWLTSRHRPDCGLRRLWSAYADHTCAPEPLRVQSCALVPLAVPPPATSRHLPSAFTGPLAVTVQRWATVPLPATSRHLPASPTIGPVPPGFGGGVPPSSLIRTLRKAASSPSPWFCSP